MFSLSLFSQLKSPNCRIFVFILFTLFTMLEILRLLHGERTERGVRANSLFSAWSLNLYKYHFIILHSARTFQHSSLRAHHTQTFLAKICANFEWPWHSCSKRLGWWRRTWCTNVLDPMIYDNGLNDMLRHLLLTKLLENIHFYTRKRKG